MLTPQALDLIAFPRYLEAPQRQKPEIAEGPTVFWRFKEKAESSSSKAQIEQSAHSVQFLNKSLILKYINTLHMLSRVIANPAITHLSDPRAESDQIETI